MLIDNFNIHQPSYQPISFNLGQGPQIPMIPNTPSFLQPLLPAIAGQVVNTINYGISSQGVHAGRYLLFNQLYQNNFQNQEFMMAVSAVIDNILLGISKNEFNPNAIDMNVINTCATRAVALMGAYNIGRYPVLRQYVPEPVVQEGMALAQIVQQQMPIVNSLKVQYMNHMPIQATGGYVPPGQGYPAYQPPVNNGNMGYSTATSTVSTFHNNQAAAFSMPGNHGSTPMTTTNDRYSNLAASAAAVTGRQGTQTTYNQQQQPVQATPAPEPTPTIWVPSTVQAHPPAYFADTETLSAHVGMDPIKNQKCIILQIQPIEQGETDMDRTRHQLNTGFTGQPDHSGKELAAIPGDLLAKQAKEVILSADFYEEPLMADGGGVVLSREEAIYKARHKLVASNKGKEKGRALTSSFLLAVPVITRGTYREAMAALTKATSYEQLCGLMNRMAAASDPEQANLVKQLDKYLTGEFNRLVFNKLSLDIKVGSFMEDAKDMPKFLNDTQGSVYGDALLEVQRDWLLKMFTPMDEAVYDQIIYTVIDPSHSAEPTAEDEHPLPYTTAVFQVNTVTAVGYTAAELNVGLLGQHSGTLSSETFPGLLTYAKTIFKATAESDHPVAHHYIVTSDSHVFEVHQSLIGLGIYMISQIE